MPEERKPCPHRFSPLGRSETSKQAKDKKKKKKSEGKREKNKKQIPSQKSTDKTDHGSTATAVVGIHAESHDTRRRLVLLQTHGSLAPRTTDDIEIGIHRVGVCGGGGNVFCTAAGGLRLDLDRRRTHCVWYCISVGTDWLVVVVV